MIKLNLLTSPIYWIAIILCLIVSIILYCYNAKILGWFGEHWTKKELKKLPNNTYKIINNIWLKVNDKIYQIDHIVVSPYGIFSVETKQYNGFITGSKYDKKWVRHVGKKKYYYTNPIRQNYGHVKALSELLNIDESKIFNIVCIPSTAKLKIKDDGEVVRNYTIKDKILSYQTVVLNDIDEIVNIIKQNKITDKKQRQEHITNIKNIIDNSLDNCPRCGGKLVERKGKYSSFIGCSNYPKCKYTERIK